MQIVRRLDPARWKTFVDENPSGNIFHTPEMFQVFSRAKGHRPELWAATNDHGQVLALLPVVKLTLMDGLLRRLTTRAVAYGSALSAPTAEGDAALQFLLRAYREQAGRDALFTEFRNMSDMGRVLPVLERSGFAHEDHLNFLVDLTQPEDTIWRNISRRKREIIRSTQKKGTRVEQATGHEHVEIAYQFLTDVYSRVQVPLADSSLFKAAFEILAPQGLCQLLLARVGDKYAGTLFLLQYHGRILYWYIGSDRTLAAYGPSELLVWHAIQWGKEHGYQTFDLGGGGKPEQEYGPREFKSRFGGVQVNYGREVCVHAPVRLKLSEVGYQVYRRVSTNRGTLA